MVERIKQIMEYYQLSPAAFAEQIGINRSNLTHLFSGRNQPSLDLAKKILHYYPDIKTEWLIMGVGQMFRNNEEKEWELKVQSEKRLQRHPEPELFDVPLTTSVIVGELPVVEEKKINEQIFDSREVEKTEAVTPPVSINVPEKEEKLPHPAPTVTKIVFFYSDNSFEIFNPNK
ncbi:MAG: helix-turn-helix transcriptional regulator [Bacteroidetes bacterium]|nr:helix-turn-helix transcriptional regulator [Bacteroidota bacterium]MCL2303299.1 helix-turn-helix transcriptional regulator [Lentimicrobiaceae bacterium]